MIFLNDILLYAGLIPNNNKVKITSLYESYTKWCEEENYIPLNKKFFKNMAISSGNFKKCSLQNGYECLKYVGNAKLDDIDNIKFNIQYRKSNSILRFGRDIHF